MTTGFDIRLVEALVEYRRPIVKNARIEVAIACARIGASRVIGTLALLGERDDDILATGEIVSVCAPVGAHRSHPVPDALAALLRARTPSQENA